MSTPRALITGVTGQDGSYLAEFLVSKGYRVFGIARRSNRDLPSYIEVLRLQGVLTLLHGDLRDIDSIEQALKIAQPDEIYNLASQSHVGISFECANETWVTNYVAAKVLFESALVLNPNVKIYQASSSEMFGNVPAPQSELSPYNPTNPYGEAKLKAYIDCVLGLRQSRGAFIASGILYNHESPRRGKNFVTRKITHSLAKIKLGQQEYLEVGNIASKRDWGYAKEYIEAMWRMLQQENPDDYVIATGTLHSVKEFITISAESLQLTLNWEGTGSNERALDDDGVVRVAINPNFYRPTDHLHNLVGDATKAHTVLGWKSNTSFNQLVEIMTDHDLRSLVTQ